MNSFLLLNRDGKLRIRTSFCNRTVLRAFWLRSIALIGQYNKLVEEKKCVKVVLNSHTDYNKVYHLNTVNSPQ